MKEKNNPVADKNELDINSDADIPGSNHMSNPYTQTEEEVEKILTDLQDQKDKYIRLLAEFENYKRRTARERVELIQTAGRDIVTALLEVLDDSDRAEKQIQSSDDINREKEGIQLVFNKLRTILQQKGLTPMESINTEFDVEKHEAITEVDAGEKMKGKVVDEVVKGYYLNDKLIRFAKVVVGK